MKYFETIDDGTFGLPSDLYEFIYLDEDPLVTEQGEYIINN